MNDASKEEARLLSGAELELVAVTRPSEIERQSVDELKAAARRLREAHDRARGMERARRARCAARPSRAAPSLRRTIRGQSPRRKLCATRSTELRRSSAAGRRRAWL